MNARQSENFARISAKSLFLVLSNRLKVFHLHLELPRDQENKNGFADEWLWFLGHRVVSTLQIRVRYNYCARKFEHNGY